MRAVQLWHSFDLGTESGDARTHEECPITIEGLEADTALDATMKQGEADSQMDILRKVIAIGSDG